jgi:magnesium-transporting ATPase (P-type)
MDTKLILDFLSKLGEQVSSTGQEVFKIYIQQAYVNGISSLIWALVLFLIFIVVCVSVGTKLMIKSKNLNKEDYKSNDSFREDEEAFFWIGLAFIGFGCILFLIFGMTELTDGIKHLINPQYYALQDLANAVKSVSK